LETLLYIETNFLLGHATGRAAGNWDLIEASSIRLVIPSCCYMESFSVLEDERKRHNRLINGFYDEIREAERNVISPRARDLVNHLQRSVVESQAVFNDFEARLFQLMETLSSRAEFIESSPEIIRDSLNSGRIDDPSDNLILASILSHASRHPAEAKAFLTENRKCFHDNLDARDALRAADIKCFADALKCLEWQRAQPES
jgi:hypothetical protein